MNNKAHLRPKDFDSNGDIIPMACKEENGDIKVGSVVKLLYWKDNKVHDFTITDIYFERYISGIKTIVKAKYYSEKVEFWCSETFFANDFFKAMKECAE